MRPPDFRMIAPEYLAGKKHGKGAECCKLCHFYKEVSEGLCLCTKFGYRVGKFHTEEETEGILQAGPFRSPKKIKKKVYDSPDSVCDYFLRRIPYIKHRRVFLVLGFWTIFTFVVQLIFSMFTDVTGWYQILTIIVISGILASIAAFFTNRPFDRKITAKLQNHDKQYKARTKMRRTSSRKSYDSHKKIHDAIKRSQSLVESKPERIQDQGRVVRTCPNCGAPRKLYLDNCRYCGKGFEQKNKK